jgi:hypothetical protein
MEPPSVISGAAAFADQAVRADLVRHRVAVARHAFDEVALDRVARRERDRMHQPVQAAVAPADLGEHGVDLRVVVDVAGQHQLASQLGADLADLALEALSLVGQHQPRALVGAGAGDAERDRALVQHAGDKNGFSLELAHMCPREKYQRIYRIPVAAECAIAVHARDRGGAKAAIQHGCGRAARCPCVKGCIERKHLLDVSHLPLTAFWIAERAF